MDPYFVFNEDASIQYIPIFQLSSTSAWPRQSWSQETLPLCEWAKGLYVCYKPDSHLLTPVLWGVALCTCRREADKLSLISKFSQLAEQVPRLCRPTKNKLRLTPKELNFMYLEQSLTIDIINDNNYHNINNGFMILIFHLFQNLHLFAKMI